MKGVRWEIPTAASSLGRSWHIGRVVPDAAAMLHRFRQVVTETWGDGHAPPYPLYPPCRRLCRHP